MQRRVSAPDVAQITLEVLDVDGVKSDDGCEESDIEFRELVAKVVGTARLHEVGFGAVKGLEQSRHVLLVGFLGGGEAGFVHLYNDVNEVSLEEKQRRERRSTYSIIDVVIGPVIDLLDLFLQLRRK